MRGRITKQPNGKYCIINYDGEIEHYNLIEQDIIDLYIEEVKKSINESEPSSYIISSTVNGYSICEKIIRRPDDTLKEMGFDKTYDELVRFVPRRPTNTGYSDHDCTMYGKCPSCGNVVQNGMGFTQEQCSKCGQILKWGRY